MASGKPYIRVLYIVSPGAGSVLLRYSKEVNQSWTLQLTSFVVREMRVELTRRN